MPEGSKTHMGGTMRLGARKTIFVEPNSISAKLYQILGGHKDDHVWERHRHRYGFIIMFRTHFVTTIN